MIPHEDLQRLKGMKHIRYRDSERDGEWKFMLKLVDDLMAENEKLRIENDKLYKERSHCEVAPSENG